MNSTTLDNFTPFSHFNFCAAGRVNEGCVAALIGIQHLQNNNYDNDRVPYCQDKVRKPLVMRHRRAVTDGLLKKWRETASLLTDWDYKAQNLKVGCVCVSVNTEELQDRL